jgi:hypothetical protein
MHSGVADSSHPARVEHANIDSTAQLSRRSTTSIFDNTRTPSSNKTARNDCANYYLTPVVLKGRSTMGCARMSFRYIWTSCVRSPSPASSSTKACNVCTMYSF